jgi:hypothetical protein
MFQGFAGKEVHIDWLCIFLTFLDTFTEENGVIAASEFIYLFICLFQNKSLFFWACSKQNVYVN